MAAGWLFLNGRMVASDRARVSVFDRGFLYGDGLFETMRVYGGRVFAWEEHLARLQTSAGFLELTIPSLPWPHLFARLLRRNGLGESDAWLRLAVTRGVSERGLLPDPAAEPTVLVACGALDPRLAARQRRGARALTLDFVRGSFLAGHKTANYLDAVAGRVLAARRGCDEGIFCAADGSVREGTVSNLFVVENGELSTPRSNGILPGISRKLVIDLARAHGIRVRERRVGRDELVGMDEVFLTSSLAEVMPVVAIDGSRIGSGRRGPLTRRLQHWYRERAETTPLPTSPTIG